MDEKIYEKIDQAIEILAGRIVQTVQPDQAMKFTQAALNLAHTKGLLAAEKDRGTKKGAGS